MKKAKFIRKLEDFNGDARLYELSPPMEYTRYEDCEEKKKKAKYVIVSAVVALYSGPETFIFSATKRGEIRHWSELKGSFRGELDHAQALNNAGYEITGE